MRTAAARHDPTHLSVRARGGRGGGEKSYKSFLLDEALIKAAPTPRARSSRAGCTCCRSAARLRRRCSCSRRTQVGT